MKKLIVVATPIGNLADISIRAIDSLRLADVILAEDTRSFRRLQAKFNLGKKKIYFVHQHAGESSIRRILNVNSGEFCYISDAGTPNLSDPAGKVVKVARELGFEITAIPGPSALTYLVSVTPWNVKEFCFVGFLPKKGTENYLKRFQKTKTTLYFFESPWRIRKTLKLLRDLFPDSAVIIGRELTKVHEQLIVEGLRELNIDTVKEKGEFVVGLQL